MTIQTKRADMISIFSVKAELKYTLIDCPSLISQYHLRPQKIFFIGNMAPEIRDLRHIMNIKKIVEA